jgi:hypothetical protein
MLDIDSVLEKIIHEIYTKSKDYLSPIIDENARVENYFSVIILGILEELKKQKIILNYEFQHLVNENKRKHIDFFIHINGNSYFMELKHLAIDNNLKSKNRRTLNFYTSSSDNGKKVGIIGDLDKLENLEQNNSHGRVSLAIISNSPSKEVINKKLLQLMEIKKKWKLEYREIKENNIGFIISKMN